MILSTFFALVIIFLYLPIGRESQTRNIGLEAVGVELHPDTHEIIGGHNSDSEQSSISSIYAIGDILHVRLND